MHLALAVVLAESFRAALLLSEENAMPLSGPPGAPPARPRLAAAGRSPPRSAC